jgi:F-type H+-transporting ATPase subunit epsilon
MNLEVLLPHRIFATVPDVSRIIVDTGTGSVGLLPHRRDCVAALVPGLLSYASDAEGEVFLAVDEGVLIKTGKDVLVSVRQAIRGTDLAKLRQVVEREFTTLDERERTVRSVVTKMEAGFLLRFEALHNA